MKIGIIGGGIAGLAVIGLIVATMNGAINPPGFSDDGIDVSGTPCEGIGAARQAVNDELQARKYAAQTTLDTAKEANSDAFWTENRSLEATHHDCQFAAMTADPCKDLFEQASSLAQQILSNIDNGFDEAKFQERERVKKEYDKCVERAQDDEFYNADIAACDAALAAGQVANQQTREAADHAAQSAYDTAVMTAENAHQQKHGILNAIEERCNESAGNTNVNIGGVTTGGTGTSVQPGNAACTGVFAGNDSDLEKRLRDLESQLQKARAAGLSEGLYGTTHLTQAVSDARQALKDSERSCNTDADCGDPEPICCTGTQVGRVFCSDGVCANERTDCEDPEICSGKPAQCVAPATGVQSQPIEISRTIPEVGTCSQNLQVLNLQQASSDSVRFEITGNIPSWLHFDNVGGALPANVNVTYSCNTVQGFGLGTYTANGTITVYNTANELINTIPLNISITVAEVKADTGETAGLIGEDSDLTLPPVSVGPTQVAFTYDHANPTCPLSIAPVVISGPPGSEWHVEGELPIWLEMPNGTSGAVPATVPMQFPCLLDRYENQTQVGNIPFIISTPDDTVETIIQVTANITNFEE